MAAVVGSLMIWRTFVPEMVPASFIACLCESLNANHFIDIPMIAQFLVLGRDLRVHAHRNSLAIVQVLSKVLRNTNTLQGKIFNTPGQKIHSASGAQ
jgi:hypothetical protein